MLELACKGQASSCGFPMMSLVSMSWRQGNYRCIGASKLLEETLTLQGVQEEDLKPGVW